MQSKIIFIFTIHIHIQLTSAWNIRRYLLIFLCTCRFWYLSLVACYFDEKNCKWKHSSSFSSSVLKYDLWLVNGNPYVKNENPLENQFSFDRQVYWEFVGNIIIIWNILTWAKHTITEFLDFSGHCGDLSSLFPLLPDSLPSTSPCCSSATTHCPTALYTQCHAGARSSSCQCCRCPHFLHGWGRLPEDCSLWGHSRHSSSRMILSLFIWSQGTYIYVIAH
jgi:hypothetical protein